MSAYIIYDAGTGSLIFDAVQHENQNKSNMVTEHPVEEGSNITDHVRPNPDHVTIEGFISNAPVFSLDGAQTPEVLNPPTPPVPFNLNGLTNVLGGALSNLINGTPQFVASVFEFPAYTDYVAETINVLDRLRTTAQLVTVACPSRIYDNMLVESFDVDRTPAEGTGANFTVELREIRTVASSVTSAPVPTQPRGNTTKSKGDQAGNEPPSAQKESLLHAALN